MCTGSASASPKRQSLRSSLDQDHSSLQPGSLKRKLGLLLCPIRSGEISYLSPPMSNPPSPPRLPPGQSFTFISASRPSTTSSPTITATSTLMPAVAFASASSLGPTLYKFAAHAPGHAHPAPSSTPSASGLAIGTSGPTQPSSSAAAAARHTQEGTASARLTSSRGGRKSKAHVASACINCKRAHLSCDVNRPCARCVASGKQDTCFDVQHKKRGRPRLREEGESKLEQVLPETSPTTALPPGRRLDATTSRAMAAPRPRRGESFRSLRSHGSGGSGMVASPAYPLPPPPTATRAVFEPHYPPRAPSHPAGGYEVPTVFLDLDLVMIKANMPYRLIMVGGQEVSGRALSDIAAPVDGESFHAIRARLRAEREAREPAYMPPIVPAGQDALHGASEADVERYTHGFDDRTYTWTHTHMAAAAAAFPARVRLAKATAYFVAVTLPTFRPVDAAASPLMAPPPSLGRHPHRPYPPPLPSPLPAAEPPTATTAFTAPRAAAPELPPARAAPRGALQLPPIMRSAAAPRPPSSIPPTARSAEEDDDGGHTPRKRRRMGIDDVLHR